MDYYNLLILIAIFLIRFEMNSDIPLLLGDGLIGSGWEAGLIHWE